MTDEMKPCPLCGGHPYREFVSDGGEIDPYPLYRVVCDDCGAQGPIATDQEAIEKWNSRPVEDALRARLLLFGYDGPAYNRPVGRGLVLLDDPRQAQVEDVLPEGEYHVHLELRPRGDV